jgi:GT2 family glycosyltransferase
MYYEVIVTDDGRDSTAAELIRTEFPWAHWVQGPQKGPAANRNSGSKAARGEWLVFTDDDCLPEMNWLSAYFEAISANRTVAVLEGKTIADRPQARYDEEAPINETGGNLWSCNFCIQDQCFQQLEGFDERFIHAAMEDVDLFARLRKVGFKWHFVPDAVVIHPFRSIDSTKFDKALWSFRYLVTKHQQLNRTYRIERGKHLIKSLFVNGVRLTNFGFKGWTLYIQEHVFLMKLIFISRHVA